LELFWFSGSCLGFVEVLWVSWFFRNRDKSSCDVEGKVTPSKSIKVPRLELMAAIGVLQIAETAGQTLALPEERWIF